MKLSVSNIAWSLENDESVYHEMQRLNFSGLEIAPTRIFTVNPYEHIHEAVTFSRALKTKYNLEICSMQSIWFGMSQRIAGTHEERQILFEYTQKALRFSDAVNCRNIVFGCPRNRNIERLEDEDIIINFLMDIADEAENFGITISLEANPAIYSTNFINTTEQAIELLNRIKHPALKLNLDTGTIICNNEDISKIFTNNNAEYINHVHISEPKLLPIKKRLIHSEIFSFLMKEGYRNYVSIETARTENLSELFESMRYVQSCSLRES